VVHPHEEAEMVIGVPTLIVILILILIFT